jgi:hypothetical protein
MPSDQKIWFFAGGETRDDKFNVFTGSFIKLMKEIAGEDFNFIKGVYNRTNAGNVIWALNNAQKPATNHETGRKVRTAFRQITAEASGDTQITLISSSSGSVLAAQTACYLACKNRYKEYFSKPFHLVLGASMISSESELYKELIRYQREGLIGTILHDEVQDKGDNAFGVGGMTRREAYANAFGLMFPFLSKKYDGPSFLNTKPDTGHIHRRRSNTVQKAIDYIDIILVQHKLSGDYYKERAEAVVASQK